MKRLLLAWLVTAASACALAQVDSQPLTCERGAYESLRPVVFAASDATAFSETERACWVDWAPAQALATRSNGQWLDVRDAGARRRLSLPGVTAIALADLPSKAFLKGQTLVLVGTGVDLKALSSQCVALRQSGHFKGVHVLLHGVRAWRLANQPALVEGSALAPDEVDAQELWLGAADDQWRIAAIGLDADGLRSLPMAATFTASASNLKQVVADLAHRISRQVDSQPHQRWLVLTATPEQLAELRALWLELQPSLDAQALPVTTGTTPWWLVGAWPAYASYLEQQKTLAAHAGRPLPRLCGM